jgi:hypothetical protein
MVMRRLTRSRRMIVLVALAATLGLVAAPATSASAAPRPVHPGDVGYVQCLVQNYAPTESRDPVTKDHYVDFDAYLKCQTVGDSHLERMQLRHVLQRYGLNSQGKGYWYNESTIGTCHFPGTNNHRFHCGHKVKCTPMKYGAVEYRQAAVGTAWYEFDGKTYTQRDPLKGWDYSPSSPIGCN